jgi:hypothetical protein
MACEFTQFLLSSAQIIIFADVEDSTIDVDFCVFLIMDHDDNAIERFLNMVWEVEDTITDPPLIDHDGVLIIPMASLSEDPNKEKAEEKDCTRQEEAMTALGPMASLSEDPNKEKTEEKDCTKQEEAMTALGLKTVPKAAAPKLPPWRQSLSSSSSSISSPLLSSASSSSSSSSTSAESADKAKAADTAAEGKVETAKVAADSADLEVDNSADLEDKRPIARGPGGRIRRPRGGQNIEARNAWYGRPRNPY